MGHKFSNMLKAIPVMALSLSMSTANAQCNIAIVVESGCSGSGGWGAVVAIEGAQSPWSYAWSNGANTQSVEGLADGIYTVTFTDANNCSVSEEVVIDCPDAEPCMLRTQTQGGWGAKPSGNNPAAYLASHWTSCFPTGITIGCTNKLKLTTSNAVMDFLPSGSTASMLPAGTLTNPGGAYSNVLAGQLVAATINVMVDACDPNFGASSYVLGDALIASGPFQGYSVYGLLTEANNFIGGCGSSFTASQLNAALTAVNESMDNGTTNTGFLVCKKDDKKAPEMGNNGKDGLLVFPNPADESLTLQIASARKGAVSVVVMDMMGRVVVPMNTLGVEAGEVRNNTIDLRELSAGTYFAVVVRNGDKTVQQFNVVR
jgi:hypothetical protein